MGRKMVVLVAITVGFLVGGHKGAAVFADELQAPQAIPEVLTLEKAMELALSNHPSLRVASGTQAINEALVGQAQSGFYPQVQGTAGKTLRTTNSTTQFSGSSVPRSTSGKTTGFYQNSVTLNQLFYDFGTTRSQVDTAQFNLKAANSDAETTVQTVVVNVQQAYFNLQQTQRLVTVNEEAINQFQKHLDLAKGRFKAGVAPKIDVTTAEVDLSNAQLNLITARNNALVARVTLNNAIFSGFLTAQQVAQARATFLRTKANGDVLRQNILLEVNQALLNLEAARERLRVTAVTVEQAKERLALVEGRYKAGLSNAVEVTDAEVALVNAQVNDVVAMSSYQAAKSQLDRAMGIITPVRGG